MDSSLTLSVPAAQAPDRVLRRSAVLRTGVHGVVVGDDLVFLDLGSDEYACLPGRAPETASAPDGALGRLGGEIAATLVADGLAIFDAVERQHPPLPPRAAADLMGAPDVRLSPRDIWTFLRAVADVRSLGDDPTVRTYLTLSGETGPSADANEVRRLALIVRRLLPWAPLRGQCLLRSAILAAFLARRGMAAEWVFGVRTWPFRAHCWVQHEGVCLNDDADRLRAYVPILCR